MAGSRPWQAVNGETEEASGLPLVLPGAPLRQLLCTCHVKNLSYPRASEPARKGGVRVVCRPAPQATLRTSAGIHAVRNMDEQLKNLAASVSRARSLEQLARPILELLQRITRLESTYLTIIDEVRGVQRVLFARNSGSIEIPEGLSVDWQDTLCKRALEASRFATDDVPGVWPESGAAAEMGLKTYMSMPVRTDDGALFGTLCGASGEAVPADSQVQDVLRLFSELIARQVDRETHAQVASDRVSRAETHARAASDRATRAESRVEAMTFTSELSSLCLKAYELGPVLNETAARFRERLFWKDALPFSVDVAGMHSLAESHPVATELLQTAVAQLEAEAGGASRVIHAGNGEALARFRHAAGFAQQGVIALVRAHSDEGLEGGVLLVSEADAADLPELERELLSNCGNVLCLMAERIGHLRELREASRQLEIQAMHDSLTGLPNRRYLVEELQRMLARSARAGECVHVAFIDLDNFKQINDRHGHEVGDEFLQAMADRLTGTTRSGDMAARYGGDEFVLVAAGGKPGQAETERQRIRTRIGNAMRGTIRLSELDLEYAGPSVGVITCDSDRILARDVLVRADEAMYAEKRRRRLQ